MWSLQLSVAVLYLLKAIFYGAVVKLCIVVIKYVLWSRKISRNTPGLKCHFFNLLGSVSFLPLTAKSRNGFSILIYAYQGILGLNKYFVQEKLFHIWMFIFPVVILAHADAVKAVYGNTETSVKPFFYEWIEIFFGSGLLVSEGSLWRSRRKLMDRCFRKDMMKEHFLVICRQVHNLVDKLKKETEEEFTKISKPIAEYSLKVTYEIVFGADEAENFSKFKDSIRAMKLGFRLMFERIMNALHWLDFLYYSSKNGKQLKKHIETVKGFTSMMVKKEKRKMFQGNINGIMNVEKGSVLNLLINHHLQANDFNESDVVDEITTFIVAATDTTAVTLSWTLYMLGLYTDKQARVYEEIDLIFGEDPERQVTPQDLNEMMYLKCFIKETLRLYTATPVQARRINIDMDICGYQIPKGTTCVVFSPFLHRDENVFPDAETFNPDRFLPENCQGLNPYAYIPFSVGPRKCIGHNLAMMNLMIAVSTLLRSYELESLDPRDQVLPTFTLTISSSKPLRVRLRPRHSKIV